MPILLDHTIVPARDNEASARFFAEMLGLEYKGPNGHFAPVYVNDSLTFDFDDRDSFESHHYAFHISDEEFKVGLFQDIDQAIAHPDQEVDKGGEYVLHQSYDTSRHLNAYLSEHRNAEFFVEGHGSCWRLKVRHYQ